MTWRSFLLCLTLLVVGIGDIALMAQEDIVAPDDVPQAESKAQDPHPVKFIAAQRAANLEKFGFEEAEIAKIIGKMKKLEDQLRVTVDPVENRINVVLEMTDDQNALTRSICGTNNSLPVRYAAMEFLVAEKSGVRLPVDLSNISALEPQDWFGKVPVAGVYQHVDAIKEPKGDSVRMAFAALMGGDEKLVLEDRAPYGRSFLANWEWDDVEAIHPPGLHDRVFSYVALMHLVFEVAAAEGGLCEE